MDRILRTYKQNTFFDAKLTLYQTSRASEGFLGFEIIVFLVASRRSAWRKTRFFYLAQVPWSVNLLALRFLSEAVRDDEFLR